MENLGRQKKQTKDSKTYETSTRNLINLQHVHQMTGTEH